MSRTAPTASAGPSAEELEKKKAIKHPGKPENVLSESAPL
jgi:hypothetical protein